MSMGHLYHSCVPHPINRGQNSDPAPTTRRERAAGAEASLPRSRSSASPKLGTVNDRRMMGKWWANDG